MWKKVSIALFAVMLFTACGTPNNEPDPTVPENDIPNEQDIAPNDRNDLEDRNNTPADQNGDMMDERNDLDMQDDRLNEGNIEGDRNMDGEDLNRDE